MNEADIVVAHAGTGTILACLQNGTPCIIVPRKASLGEHRNDHQFATARRFEGRKGVFVVWDIADLPGILDRADALDGSDGINPFAEERLLQAIRDFIDERD
jgi:UDP-N-acetylglucosamine transferase subunit ALG13